jgi:hypothetical protein
MELIASFSVTFKIGLGLTQILVGGAIYHALTRSPAQTLAYSEGEDIHQKLSYV